MIGFLVLGGTIAVLVTICGLASKHDTPVRAVLWRYAFPAAGATLVLAPVLIRSVPVIGLAIACIPGVVGFRGARRYVVVRRPREQMATLLAGRLTTIIGSNWGQHAMEIEYVDPGAPSDVKIVLVKLPRGVLPSTVTDKCKAVVSETIGGKWTVKTRATILAFTPAVKDPPAVKHLKTVLLDQKAIGTGGRVEVLEYADDGTIVAFQAFVSPALSNIVTSPERQAAIVRLIEARIPIAEGSWACTWELTGTPVVECRRSAFRDIIYMKPPERFVTSKAEAAEAYPKAVFEIGIHADGRICTRTPIREPHGITAGSTGKGKTSHLHVGLVSATAWGFVGITVDGKLADSFVGFMDWPNVQIVANDIYSAIRTIYFVAEILSHRQEGGRLGDFPVDQNVPVWFILDEHQYLMKKIQSDVWPLFKGEDDPATCPIIPLIDSIGELARQFRIHMENGTQKPESKNISQNILTNSDKKSQWGDMSGAQSQAYWGDYHTGASVPPIRGRGVIKTLTGKPEQLQGYFVPDPAKATTAEEFKLLAALMPPVSLYRRIVFDIPDPDSSSWEDLVTAPWFFADDRPDLDPLSPHYAPRAFLKYSTIGELNPATLDIDGDEIDDLGAAPVDLDADDDDKELDQSSVIQFPRHQG